MRVKKGSLKTEKQKFEDQVIQSILDHKGEVRAKDLEQDIREKTGITSSTFYKRLAKLVEKGSIVKDRAEWRNSIYRVNYERVDNERLILPSLKLEVLSNINEAMQPFETKFMRGEINEAGLLRELSLQIAELSVWALLKQIETGEQFTEIASFYLSYIGGAQALLKRTIIQKETPYLELEKRIALSDPKVAFKDLLDFPPALDRYEEALGKLYPRVKEFEALYTQVIELFMRQAPPTKS
jgi:predicted transcriptional regulator